MRIGFVGMGKLGLPVAYTFASKGHTVYGYDLDKRVYDYVHEGKYPHVEEGLLPLMSRHSVTMTDSLDELIQSSDMVFVPIQTPHDPLYEGCDPLPEQRVDFDYSALKGGIKDIADTCARLDKAVDLVIISTVLPGTTEKHLRPLLNDYTRLVYEPMFIAMGTVVQDVLNPEFVLCGVDDPAVADRLEEFYKTIHDKPVFRTDITTAEAIKVSYNTFITTKTVLGNLWGEIAHKTGANVDDIYQAWTLATDRLISPKYLKSGVGDGGGCHPRDNIALSWLAREYGLSYDYFEALMLAREKHMAWIGSLAEQYPGDKLILGAAFKPETEITTGSPSVLLSRLTGYPIVETANQQGVYIIGVKKPAYAELKFPHGSTVIDPFRYIPDQDGVRVIGVGNGRN